jgi:hypothetical protein
VLGTDGEKRGPAARQRSSLAGLEMPSTGIQQDVLGTAAR